MLCFVPDIIMSQLSAKSPEPSCPLIAILHDRRGFNFCFELYCALNFPVGTTACGNFLESFKVAVCFRMPCLSHRYPDGMNGLVKE